MATDAEINEAVAKKFGWKPKTTKYSTFDGQHDAEVIRKRVSRIPNYCRDIGAAFEILEKYGFVLSRHPGGFTCELITNGSSASSTLRYEESADTAPMAICLAYLKTANGV